MAKILHITTVPCSLGFLDGQVGALKERGFSFDAISSSGEALWSFGRRHGVRVHAVEMTRAVSPFADLRAVAELIAVIRRVSPDLVHAHTPKAGLLGMISASVAGVQTRLYTMRGLLTETATGPRRLAFLAAERVASRLAHRVVCQSPSLRQSAIDEGIVGADHACVLGRGGNGTDATHRFEPDRWREKALTLRAQLGISPEVPVLGFVGRLVGDKGVHELCEAWNSLRIEFPRLHWLIVGPEEVRDALDPEVLETLRHDSRVHLIGSVEEVAPYYGAMNVVALPSYREGLPNVPLEASAMSTPVVATRVTGCIDAVVDGETGVLVPPRSSEALRVAIASYLREPEKGRKHGAAGRRFVLENYAPERLHRATELLYRTMLGEHR